MSEKINEPDEAYEYTYNGRETMTSEELMERFEIDYHSKYWDYTQTH